MSEQKEFLRHLLATIAYRLAKTVHGVNQAFYTMETDYGIRRPAEILRHMSQVLNTAHSIVMNTPKERLPELDGVAELDRFYVLLKRVDQIIAHTTLEEPLSFQLIQGPLADVLTHIGQIALLRRAFGEPVRGENFMKAGISIGQLNRDAQPLNTDLFE